MSGGAKPTFLMPAYDAQELRRRMAVGFTIGELYRLAEKLGVPPAPSWSNSPQDAARDIVRHFERSGALPFLVEALQEAKPLIEWPAPLPPQPPGAGFGAAAPAEPPAAAAAPGATSFGAPVSAAFDDAPTTADSPGDRPTPISTLSAAAVFASSVGRSNPPAAPSQPPAGFAPAVMPRPGDPPASPSPAAAPEAPVSGAAGAPVSGAAAGASMSPVPGAPPSGARSSRAPGPGRTEVDSDLAAFMAAGAPPSRGPASAQPVIQDPALSPGTAWPGTVRPAGKAGPRSLPDYRLLAGGGAGLLIVAVAIAFLVGRASSAAPPETASGEAAAAPSAGDRVVVSQRAVELLSASLARVARDCQIDLSTLRGRPLFQVAYHRCGPLPPQAYAPQRSTYDPGPVNPSSDDSPDDAPSAPPRQARPASGGKLQKVDTSPGPGPVSGGSGCLSRCSKSHGACTSRCGAEPKQGSQYDAYQGCLGGCLKALSQCKMGCQ